MNNYVTYCAQAKLLRLIEERGAASVRVIAHRGGSVSIEPVFSAKRTDDIILTPTPTIYTDLFTLRQLTEASIDFDYPSAEFVIRRERRELSAAPV